jgi:hypothetical protein
MRSSTTILALAVAALVACDSNPRWKRRPRVDQEFNTSSAVLVGKIVEGRNLFDAEGFLLGTVYKVQPVEWLKGSSQNDVQIYDENSSGRFPMKVGEKYLLFAYEGTFEGTEGVRLAINSSGNSAVLDHEAMKSLQTVRKLNPANAQPGRAENGR